MTGCWPIIAVNLLATLNDLQQLRRALNRVGGEASKEVKALLAALDGLDPVAIRQALHEAMPVLTDRYSQATQAIAAEWYESIGKGQAVLSDTTGMDTAVHSQIGYRAQTLEDTTRLAGTLAGLVGDVEKYVLNAGRQTIIESAEKYRQRWVRVPGGKDTCAFCLMLASRSAQWMYKTKETAGDQGTGKGDRFHNDCKCMVVPGDDPGDIPWNPDGYFTIYRSATDAVGNRLDTTEILAEIRRQNIGGIVRDAPVTGL